MRAAPMALAEQLMTELQRQRAGAGPWAVTAQRFVQAIYASVDGPDDARRHAAASRYRIAPCLLDALAGCAMAPLQAGEAQRIKALLPDIVRQVARVEAGLAVGTLRLA